MYSDTKQSYETATVTSKVEDNPEFLSLQKEYRIQKDRLLAWGLDWSDSDTAAFPDVQIDNAVDQAGFGDVVIYIMSTIQDLLVQSEKLQASFSSSFADSKGNESPRGFSPYSNNAPERSVHSSTWSPEQLVRSKSLLAELTACIDYLFKLSEARRAKREDAKDSSVSKESLIKDLEQVRRRTSMESDWSAPTMVNTRPSNPSLRHAASAPPSAPTEDQATSCANVLGISPAAVRIQPTPTDANKPPAYDAVMGEGIIRTLGIISGHDLTSEEQQNLQCSADEKLSVLIESTPVRDWSKLVPDQETILKVQSTRLHKDVSKVVSMPRLLGYGNAAENAQHVAVYRLSRRFTSTQEHSLNSLNSLFSTGGDSSDGHMPPLEARFRLALNLMVSVLQFQGNGCYHGAVNSNNILLAASSPRKAPDFRSPLLLSQLNFGSTQSATSTNAEEPFSTRLYRHPQEQELKASPFSWTCDAYSLGLILLEIGLWTPARRLWKSKYDGETFKSRIRAIYTQKLASRCGSVYMKAVQALLDAPELYKSGENVSAPIGYMTTILEKLARCCAMDVEGPPTDSLVNTLQNLAVDEQKTAQAQRSREQPSDGVPAMDQKHGTLSRSESTRARSKTHLRKWDTIDIPQEDLDLWNNLLMPRLSKLLQSALGKSAESCSASLMMIGPSLDTAKTTICIQCSSVDLVRKTLKQNFRCKSGWGLVVLRGDIQRCNRRRKPAKQTVEAQAPPSILQQDAVQVDSYYQQRPCSGASIGAYRDLEHLPPVSFGGAVTVGGEIYGMTVHHMLDSPSEDEEAQPEAVRRSAATSASAMEDLSFMGNDSDIPYDPYSLDLSDDEVLDLAESEDGNDEFWFSEVAELTDDDGFDDAEDDDVSTIGDTEGVDPLEADEDLVVTQPAIDDVEDDFFPSLEDRDDDHLSSHTLGYVHASSGIKRITRNGHKHEVDWALIKINQDRLPEKNAFGQHADSAIITKIAPLSSLPRTSVLCNGRTSGLQRGRISPALSLVKMRGRESFSSSYCVDGGLGIPGDSGAWVVDPVAGTLCGHVLAWGSRSKMAFIAPMEVLKEDIERKIGGVIRLPEEEEVNFPIKAGSHTATYLVDRTRSLNLSDDFADSSSSLPPAVPPKDPLHTSRVLSATRSRSNSPGNLQSLSSKRPTAPKLSNNTTTTTTSPSSASTSTLPRGLPGQHRRDLHSPASLPLMMR